MPFAGFIHVEKDKPQDPKLYDVVDRLLAAGVHVSAGKGNGEGIPESVAREVLRNAILGGLVTLWCYADRHIRDENVLPMSLSGCAQVTGLPVTWLRELPKEWLTLNDDGVIELPNYREHNKVIPKAERDVRSSNPSAVRMRRMRRKRRASLQSHGDVTSDASQTPPHVHVQVQGPLQGHVPVHEGEKSASQAAPARRAAAPRKKPEVPWQPPAKDSTWESHSPPAGPPRGASFEDDFRRRFGVTPGEAHELREKAAEAKKDDPPKF